MFMHILTLAWGISQARPNERTLITVFHEIGIVTVLTAQFKKERHKKDQELAQDHTNCKRAGPEPGLGPNQLGLTPKLSILLSSQGTFRVMYKLHGGFSLYLACKF